MLNIKESSQIKCFNQSLPEKKKKNIFLTLIPIAPIPEPTDNASVNFVKYKGDYYVSTETNYMHRVDPDTLESKQKV